MRHGPVMHRGPAAKQLAAFEIKLKDREQIAAGTSAFIFEKPEGFRYGAGQHIRMTLIAPPETDAAGSSRFFSMASTPDEPDLVFAMRMSDSAFKRVLGGMNIGESVRIEARLAPPQGAFMLHEDAARPAVFIAGGIGIVPAYCIIKDALGRKLPHQLVLFYSNRRPEEAPFLNELQSLAEQNPSFKLIATITEPEKSSQSWNGEVGVINGAMLKKYVADPRSPIYYAVGLPDMVGAVRAVLMEMGVDQDNIRAEEFAACKMGHHKESPQSSFPSRVRAGAGALLVLAVVAAHIVVLSHVHLATLSWNHPISSLALLLLLAMVALKLFAVLKHKGLMRAPYIKKTIIKLDSKPRSPIH